MTPQRPCPTCGCRLYKEFGPCAGEDAPTEAEGRVVAWKFRMDGVDQVMLDEDADIHVRRNGTPLYMRQSAPEESKP